VDGVKAGTVKTDFEILQLFKHTNGFCNPARQNPEMR
jgi:hypothetical protein